MQLVVRGSDQIGVIGFRNAAALALRPRRTRIRPLWCGDHKRSRASSRSAVRRAGTCGLNPIRCSKYDTSRSVYRTWNSRRSASRSGPASTPGPRPIRRLPGPGPARPATAPAAAHPAGTEAARALGRQRRRAARLPAPPPLLRRFGTDPQLPGPRTGSMSCSNICAACSRSFSRRACPSADSPPPSGYYSRHRPAAAGITQARHM
jgi:hypothetical protein